MATKDNVRDTIRSYVILDLETTSLPNDKPVKITEIAMVAAMREHVLGFGDGITSDVALPRVLSKLNICVYPARAITQASTEITYLSNELLEHQNPFDEHLFNILESFLKRLPQPVCIIAHNGNRFDFPVLQAEIQKIGKEFPDHIMCADSLPGFRELLQTLKHEDKSVSDTDTKLGIAGDSIIKRIQPLKNNGLLQENRTMKQNIKYPDIVNSNLGLEIEDPHWNDYDEELCSALEAIETSPLSKMNDIKNSHIALDLDQLCSATVRDFMETVNVKFESDVKYGVINGKDEGNETKLLQQQLEKTPNRISDVRTTFPNLAAGDSLVQTPPSNATPTSTKAKRTGTKLPNAVRKKLNFSPEKKTPRSFKLDDIYRFIFKRNPKDCHRAENDALILLECIVAIGHQFTDWADKNAVKLNSMKKMW